MMVDAKLFTPTDGMRKALSSIFDDLKHWIWVHPEHSSTAWLDKRSVNPLVRHGWLIPAKNGGYDLSDEALAYCQQEFAQPFEVADWIRHHHAAKLSLQQWIDKHKLHPIEIRFLYEECAKRWHAASVDYNEHSGGVIIDDELHHKANVARSIVNLIDNLSLN